MCGVAAIISPSQPPAAITDQQNRRVHNALRVLSTRGPDAQDTWTSPDHRVILGHTRLAIQDLSASGHQPMVIQHDGRTFAITYNGEIYNAPALRDELTAIGHTFAGSSDTEVLLRAIASWGLERAINRILGMFAFVCAVGDGRSWRILAATDHAGMKPLFWTRAGDALCFASTADALRALAPNDTGTNAQYIASVLTLGAPDPTPPTPPTPANTHRLSPGRALVCTDNHHQPEVIRWHDDQHDKSGPDATFEQLWPTVVADHTLADVPVGVFLSAGIDSACVACALADAGRKDVVCLSLGLERDDESQHAARLCAHLGLEHEIVSAHEHDPLEMLEDAADAFDEPQGYSALLTARAIARAAAGHGKVFLGGDGGDEAFCGYPWYRERDTPYSMLAEFHARPDKVATLARVVARPDAPAHARNAAQWAWGTLSFVDRYCARTFPGFSPWEARALAGSGFATEPNLAPTELRERDDASADTVSRLRGLDLAGLCARSILPKVDRASMASSIEVRCPMLDRRVLGLWRPADGVGKPALRAYLQPRVPGGHLDKPKQGFSLRARDPRLWRDTASRVVPGSAIIRDGVLRADSLSYVHTNVDEMSETRAFTLAMLALWYARRYA